MLFDIQCNQAKFVNRSRRRKSIREPAPDCDWRLGVTSLVNTYRKLFHDLPPVELHTNNEAQQQPTTSHQQQQPTTSHQQQQPATSHQQQQPTTSQQQQQPTTSQQQPTSSQQQPKTSQRGSTRGVRGTRGRGRGRPPRVASALQFQ